MEKKNRPVQQAANNIDIRGSDVTPPAPTTQAPRRTPKKHRARELERRLDIQIERIDEKNPDGIGSHLRYRFTGRGDVLKVIRLVNHNATAGGYNGLSQPEIADILNLYQDNLTAA
ncbi:hypothetical protein ACNAT8_12375 [Klebsiella quasipneumoniae]|uniref:hypothetical protein n=1 Tax=Klebsiella quasipneumoniae TaxID=1463165 RepID=UPI002AB8C138|nr:hypothetical protein [Klebsiella quasipneumoniae]MDZ1463408.1 hypothetical protein [Klebsiella quasipneumoniae]